ncbi:helix-turn-helix transcriptional regulator [Echinimonas agarilytica]|uniref:Helix-turn-helix transcriptional regulator n=1 Tax=Echinimonas agarilytica TaxID=1215918 RepID=A0AA41W7Z6_9GAMM|nr:AraC family transcriptional regulator [Echinimonas agarilytica]MCM2680491.1 helix-turn-helix transcriptional regulator [Echinimonas agarilytica]
MSVSPVSFENIHLPSASSFGLRHYQLPPSLALKAQPHFHMMYECMWFREIEGEVEINDVIYSLSPGTLMFVPTLQAHSMRSSASDQDFFLFQYEARLYRELDLTPSHQPMMVPLVSKLDQDSAQHLNHLLKWSTELGEQALEWGMKASLLKALLLFIHQQQLKQQLEPFDGTSPAVSHKSMARILPLLQTIEQGDALRMSLDDAAEFCGMSRYHFSRTFKSLFGQNFKDYLLRRKISAAVSLLIHSEQSIADIAYQCEFTDTAYFCSKFRQQMGQTPGEFRRLLININEF